MTEHTNRLRLLSSLIQEQNLLDRIDNSPPPIPLRNRIDPAPMEIEPIQAYPQGARFRKSKIILREKEFWNIILAADERLQIIDDKSEVRDVHEDHWDGYQELMNNFKDFKDTFKERADKFTNKNWRYIRKDLNAIRRVSLRSLGSRWDEVCAEIAALGRQKLFIYNKD